MITTWLMTNLQLVSLAAVVFVGGVVALTYGREKLIDENGERYKIFVGSKLIRTGIITGVLGLGVLTFPFVPAGYEGVIFDRRPNQGVVEEPRNEGFTFTVPLMQSSINMNVRKQLYTVNSNVQTYDLQEVLLPLAVNYLINDSTSIYQEVGTNYVATILDPAVFQAATVAAGQVTAESIARSRAELTANVAAQLTADLAVHGIEVVDVAIKDAVFDKDFILSVKNKVIAEQKAAEAERLVDVARFGKDAAILTGEGVAGARLLEGTAESEVQRLLRLEVNEVLVCYELAKKGVKCVPEVVMGDGAEAIIPLPEITSNPVPPAD